MKYKKWSFVEETTFSPYCENLTPSICQQEVDLWNSSNPLGSIIYLDISGDDGVVACTKFTSSYWYFMTMNAPYAGNHPVSGTRQFGYEQNLDGTYNFFVRGVDRIDNGIIEFLASTVVFGGADELWVSFQNGVSEFINNPVNPNNAIKLTPIKNRPQWDKVNDILNGNEPISILGCE